MRFFLKFTLFFLIGINVAHSADIQKLEELFKKNFHTMYHENHCGQNIERLIRAAMEYDIDLTGAHVLQIENQGEDTFGMVAAHQARETVEWNGKTTGIDMNWYFHVVLLAEGFIFDFDFRNEPTIIDLQTYLEQNFIIFKKRSNLKFRKEKLGRYLFSLYPINKSDSLLSPPRKVLLQDYLPEWFSENASSKLLCNKVL